MRNAMLYDFRACQLFPLRYDYLRHARQVMQYALEKVHTAETTALSRNWKKTPVGVRESVRKVCFTLCGAGRRLEL